MYIYNHAAYIDKVCVLNTYGSSDDQIPDFIRWKEWPSFNPFVIGGQVCLRENGSCRYNHNMSAGIVSFQTSILNL